jgi:endonuclease/exonuclease/phosphatase family metal-dependent hydrolase
LQELEKISSAMPKIFFIIFVVGAAFYSLAGSQEKVAVRPAVLLGLQDICAEPWMCRDSPDFTAASKAIARGERPLRIASYNIHKCTGMDAQRDPGRIAEVIRSLDADVISLQEVLVDPGEVPSAQVRYLAQQTGMYAAIAAPTKRKKDGLYGNALLSRFPIVEARLHDITVGSSEPRGIIDADVVIGDATVRVIATHFGLWPAERLRQADRLLEILPQRSHTPLIVMGDMNGWVPGSPVLRRLTKRLGNPVSAASFPSSFALLPLDKIWVLPPGHLVEGGVHLTRLSRVASDHLPLAASIYLRL